MLEDQQELAKGAGEVLRGVLDIDRPSGSLAIRHQNSVCSWWDSREIKEEVPCSLPGYFRSTTEMFSV